jgi:hypothetical protein
VGLQVTNFQIGSRNYASAVACPSAPSPLPLVLPLEEERAIPGEDTGEGGQKRK